MNVKAEIQRLKELPRAPKPSTEAVEEGVAIDGEIEEVSLRPDIIPADVWQLMQDNGRIATERLNEILTSPRFHRLKPADQAKIIQLAQNRAYGMPQQNTNASSKRRASRFDVTRAELADLVGRATLPEYKMVGKTDPDD